METVQQDLSPEQIKQIADKRRREQEQDEAMKISNVLKKVEHDCKHRKAQFPDLTNENIYNAHARLLITIANEICLAPQKRKFVVDDHNKQVLKFLLYYFNNCQLAETVFPDKRYKLTKNILIMGGVGTGKTMLMQIFSEYLRRTNNPMFFYNLSVTQMVNYYTIHSNLDRYTYNEENSKGFMPQPVNVCLNDIGMDGRAFYGMNTQSLTIEFLHARNEIWTQTEVDGHKFAHLTTNLTLKKLKEVFADDYGRLLDRFKTYNIISLTGDSRR